MEFILKEFDICKEENRKLKEEVKKLEEEKMRLELDVADIVHDHKIKMDATRLKIRNIRKYAIDKEAWFHYAVGSIATLVITIIIGLVVLFRFT